MTLCYDIVLKFGLFGSFHCRYAKLAEASGVELLIVENELMTALNHKTNGPRWKKLVASVKEVFTGRVTAKQLFNSMADPPHPFTDIMDILGE